MARCDFNTCLYGCYYSVYTGFPSSSNSKASAWVQSLVQDDPLEKEMATHSRILTWRVSWTEEPGGLQSLGSQRVGHDSDSHTHTHTHTDTVTHTAPTGTSRSLKWTLITCYTYRAGSPTRRGRLCPCQGFRVGGETCSVVKRQDAQGLP